MIAPTWRVILTLVVVGLAFAGLSVRLLYLELYQQDFLQDQGDARTIRMERIDAHRGMVLDRNGKPLAVSTPVMSVWANPGELPADPARLAAVAEALELQPERFVARIAEARHREFVYLKRHLQPGKARAVLALDVPGIYADREYHRYYPAGEVAAHVVGFTDVDDHGQEGLELSFEHWLAGKPGRKKVLKNLHGDIVRDIMPVAEAVPGKNLELSIDLRLQYLAYRELKSAVTQYGASSGSMVILDVATGQVLAMVNQPSYNPNNRKQLDLGAVRNRAVTDVFEPGSTVKPFTVAVALQDERYDANSKIDTNPGYIRVANKLIRDPSNRGEIDLGGIIAHSSQVGISKLALNLDEHEVWEMFRAIGFGEATGFGYPGESSGYLPSRRSWKDIERVTFAYGYGLTVTPLQLANAYLTIASGGVRRDITILAGQTLEGERVMPESLADDVKTMLSRVVSEGTGRLAAIDAYPVAGKTGTARKLGKDGYEDTRHIAFFTGMVPADDPRLVGVVLINEAHMDSNGGGAIAAPVFSRVMAAALRILNVPPAQVVAEAV